MAGVEYQTPQDLREALAGMFRLTAVGLDRAMTMAQIRQRPNLAKYDERTIRRAIKELLLLDRLLIGSSSSKGYYRIITERERAISLHEVGSRLREHGIVFRVLAETPLADASGQMTLDDSLDPEDRERLHRWVTRLLSADEDEAAA